MTKHLADHRQASDGGRVRHFMRLASDRAETAWTQTRQKPRLRAKDSTRLAEYIRIEKGIEA